MQRQASKRRVVVVGGGVIGCATAFELARAGCHVTLMERDAIGAHASSKSAGNLNPLIGTAPGQIDFALAAFHLHGEVNAALREIGCADYRLSPVKRVHLGFDAADRFSLESVAAACATDRAFGVRWLNGAAVHGMEPRLAPEVEFGLLTAGSFSLSSHDFTCALARGAARLGAEIVVVPVTGIITRNDRVVAVQTSAGPIACDALVLATGPWIAETKDWLGVTVAVEPVKGQMLRMRLDGGAPAYDLTWKSTSLYRRQDDEVWVGVTAEHNGFESMATAEGKAVLIAKAMRFMPAIKHAVLIEHTAALRPVPVSGEVIASRAPGWQNVYLANGGGAKGILLSVAIARKLRDLLQQSEGACAADARQGV